jgi:hypothetical protein
MENPLEIHGKRVSEMLDIDSSEKSLRKLVHNKRAKKLTEREEKEQDELKLKIQREREDAVNRSNQERESDSDSEIERMVKKKKKTANRQKSSTTKNIKRKPKKQNIPPVEEPVDVVIDTSMLVCENGPEVDMSRMPKNPLMIYSKKLEESELSHLSAKDLQKEDQKNPLASQKLFYMEPDQREPMALTTFDEDKECLRNFQHGLTNTMFTKDRMSATLDRVKRGLTGNWSPKNKEEFFIGISKSVQRVTRKEEEAWLRTPMSGERRCIRDAQCEGTKIPGCQPVILVEYLTPSELEEKERRGNLPSNRKMCVMCERYCTCYNFINIKAECSTLTQNNLIVSKRANIVGKKGEYVMEQTIMSNSKDYHALPFPVVLHVRKYYRQVVKNGVTYYEQDPSCYRRPEDVSQELFP